MHRASTIFVLVAQGRLSLVVAIAIPYFAHLFVVQVPACREDDSKHAMQDGDQIKHGHHEILEPRLAQKVVIIVDVVVVKMMACSEECNGSRWHDQGDETKRQTEQVPQSCPKIPKQRKSRSYTV
eukprot:CAMPEP_0202723408 /NCGR_PEP_ID=MMETSP1385-20130828/165551_1 /ASSEMBLY_ACC=CAM_ASM_000861 /TAXON_ID=933848 /ORGANISM="Elphidium margaritaceum" /LENGTH=124 /DNA_ID=CAMNT_0049388541 /DNA_START=67 /DNA_END=441 /DNA_ORIENTATION=-